MVISTGNILLIGSLLLFASIVASKVSNRFGTPMLLLFLCVGMLFGTDGLGIEFDNFAATQFLGMVALSIILFSGGMDTSAAEIRPVMKQGVVLATVGVVLTTLFTGSFIHFAGRLMGFEVSLSLALLIAAVMSSTDSASVFSILRAKRQGLKENLRPLLELESGSNDPMAYILTIMLIEVVQGGGTGTGEAALLFLAQMGIGSLAGYTLARMAVGIINRLNLSNKSLYSVLLLSMVFFIFAFTDLVGGNGYLAVYIAGIVMGNRRLKHKSTLTTFFDGFTWLCQIVMFLALGLLVNPSELVDIAPMGLAIALFIIFISRPLAVWLSLLPWHRKFSIRAKHYISWVGLRGAAPILFATYPKLAELDPNNTIFNIVFFITLISLLVQGTTVSRMAEVLGVSEVSPQRGFEMELPEDIKAALKEVEATEEHNRQLKEIPLPDKTLVMLIRRGEEYIIPNGSTTIHKGDRLLLISEDVQREHPADITRHGSIAHLKILNLPRRHKVKLKLWRRKHRQAKQKATS